MNARHERTICPRCGTVVQIRPPVLTDTSIDVWEAGGRLFWLGGRCTVRELAEKSGYSASTIHAHLQRLLSAGLVERVPLGKNGHNGVRRRYEYRGCLSKSLR